MQCGVPGGARLRRAVRAVQNVETAELVEADEKIELSRHAPHEFLRECALPAMIGMAANAQDAHRQATREPVAGFPRREDGDTGPELSDAPRDADAIELQAAP